MLRYIALVAFSIMAEITPTDIAEAVAKQIPAFFNDAFDQFTQGEGGYLANGMPEGLVAQAGQAVGRAACRRFGANPVGSTLINSERFERACRPYLDTLSPGNGLGADLPFTGGQCEGVLYRLEGDIQYDILICNTGETVTVTEFVSTEIQYVGPIVSITPEYFGSSPCGPNQLVFRVISRGGLDNSTTFFKLNPLNSIQNAKFLGSAKDATNFEGNCGFPAPIILQPRPQPDPTPPPFRFNPSPNIDFGIDVTVNPDGSITFDVGDGDVTVNPFPDDGGDGGGSGEPNPLPPGGQGEGGDPQDTSEGEVEGEDPTRYLVGVLVETIEIPPRAKTRFNNTEAYYAGLYYVYMGGDEGLAQAPAALVSQDQFFYAPEGANRFKVVANTGVTLRATPYWRDVIESA